MYLRMLNAVSSGSGLANVTPVRTGGRRSNSCGSRVRPQPASEGAASSKTAIGSGDRWPLRFGSLTAPPHTPGSLTSGATGRLADMPAPPTGGPEGEDARGRVGGLSGAPSRGDRPSAAPASPGGAWAAPMGPAG